MNVDSPKAYTIPAVDSMPAEMTTPLPLSPLRLVPVGTKAVDLDFDGAACLPMPVWSCSATPMPHSASRAIWPPYSEAHAIPGVFTGFVVE